MIKVKKFSYGLSLILLVSVACVLGGCSKVTPENYKKLNSGMTFEEVQKIIGEPTSCESNIGIKSCTWKDGDKTVDVKFLADKVFLFSSKNL